TTCCPPVIALTGRTCTPPGEVLQDEASDRADAKSALAAPGSQAHVSRERLKSTVAKWVPGHPFCSFLVTKVPPRGRHTARRSKRADARRPSRRGRTRVSSDRIARSLRRAQRSATSHLTARDHLGARRGARCVRVSRRSTDI